MKRLATPQRYEGGLVDNVLLLRGISKIVDQTERDETQYQNNHKENETAQAAVLETFSTRDFYAVKYPIGYKVEAAPDHCVVNDFQVNAPKSMLQNCLRTHSILCHWSL